MKKFKIFGKHSENIDKVLLPLELTRELQFFRLLNSAWVLLIFYSIISFVLAAKLAFAALFIGAVVFCPLTWWMEKKKFHQSSRLFFVASCNFYIFVTSLGFAHQVSAEYFYLPATMLPLLIFETSKKKQIWGSISVTFMLGLITIFGLVDFIPKEWLVVNAPIALLKNINFLGAFTLTLVCLLIFMKITFQLKDLLVSHVELKSEKLIQLKNSLSEAQTIAKVGSWNFDLLANAVTWTSELYRIFEIDEPQPKDQLFSLFRACIHPEDILELDQKIELAAKHGKEYKINHRIVLDNGKRIKHVQGIGKVTKDSAGVIVLLSGTCQDRTAEVEMQQQLQLERDKAAQKKLIEINDILSATPSCLKVINSKGELLEMNKQGLSLIEAENFQSVVNTNIFDLIEKSHRANYVEYNKRICSGHKDTLIFEIVSLKGTRRWFESYSAPYVLPSGEMAHVAITNDITLRIQLESDNKLQKAMALQNSKLASLGEMSAGVAHEINNPLAIIMGSLSLLTKYKDDPEKFASKINALQKATDRIAKIVKGLKKFSRSSEGSVFKTETLNDIVTEVLVLTEAKSKRHSTPVTLSTEEDLSIHCDGVEIQQVIINLVNNAIDAVKFQPERWVRLNCFVEAQEIVLQLMDSGAGISESVELKMFQPFFTTKPVGEGTGLGLSISKGILDQHKAKITLNRSFNNTCFEIRFPKAETIIIAA